MTHKSAIAGMVLVTLMWSIAGVVTRQLHAAEAFEITFWRSAFNALALGAMLLVLRGPSALAATFARGGRTLWLSGVCWSVMFTAFMVALTLTTVANVLVTMALSPLFTALLSRFVLGRRLPLRTWGAIVVAGAGIGWMYGTEVQGADPRHFAGVSVALLVPIAAAVNWSLIQHATAGRRGQGGEATDLLPAVLIGALLSAAVTAPLAWPFAASAHDLGLLALLGLVQLAIPCLLAVAIGRVLPAPEIALLSLLEVVFGVLWAWAGAGERPSPSVLGGGALVLGALVVNESLALRRKDIA